MVLETDILPFWTWVAQNAVSVAVTLLALFGLSVLIGFLAGSIHHGPIESVRLTLNTIRTGISELFQLSPRRVLAIASLSFRESVRRRVFVVVFIVFACLLMFGGWFLDLDSTHPARLYLSFVMTSSAYLVIFLAVFLSVFSIPNDIKSRTIYTIVTKPVRAWEFVIGRMIGFCAVGTVLLLVMGLAGYVFVLRFLSHTHTVQAAGLSEEIRQINKEPVKFRIGLSAQSFSHRHNVEVDGEAKVTVSRQHDHTHEATVDNAGNARLDEHRGMLLARVPMLGKLRFLDRQGKLGDGVNPGYEWKYRKYIEGGTLATAIWKFKDVREEDFPDDHLRLEMTIRVFRTYKGLIESGLTGTIELVRPAPLDETGVPTGVDGGLRSVALDFTALDNEVFERKILRKISGIDAQGNEREVDIFDDLVNNGELEIWVRCLDRAQYFGMASADMYLRATNRPFAMNFAKGFLSIWFQMVVVTCFGVMFSTFLSSAVAMLATTAAMVIGLCKQFVFKVASGELPGGGPLESMIRAFRQDNQMVPLEDNLATWVIKHIDAVLMHITQSVGYAMPDGGKFNTSNFIAYGYNVPGELIGQHFLITVMYCVALAVAAYALFKTREIAA